MATTITDETLRICRLAMYQLRQDVGVPASVSAAASDTSTEWTKCKGYFEIAFNEVLKAHNWTWTRGSSAVVDYSTKPDNWPEDAKNALVYCLARELAVPIAGRTEDMKNCHQLYQQKLITARLTDLTSELSSNTDPVLAQLVANFKADDPGLINAFTVYTNRKTAVYTACTAEVKATLGITTLDDLATACVNALSVARLSTACGLDANMVQLAMNEYAAKIQQWRKVKLDETRTTDVILDQLVGLFKGDDTSLANAWSTYETRKATVLAQCTTAVQEAFGVTGTLTGVPALAANCLAVAKLAPAFGLDGNVAAAQMQEYDKLLAEYKQAKLATDVDTESSTIYTACLAEVKQTLGTTTVDALMIAATKCLCYARNGARYGYDANFVSLKEQEYAAKIQQWRKIKLDETLAGNTDPVLAQLLANFKADDGGITNAFTVYTQRSTNVKALAEAEINREQEWQTAFDYDASTAASHVAYPAWVALCVSKLALVCGLDVNAAALLEKKYASELQAAKVTDLENARQALTDEDTKEVLSLVLANFNAEDSHLPRSMDVVTERIEANTERVRAEIMEAHNWSFARDEYMTGGCTCSPNPGEAYPWSTPVPPKCARVLACRGMDGRQVEWKIDGKNVLAMEPVQSITYLRDVDSLDRWPRVLRAAYVARLAAEVAAMVSGSGGEAQRLWQIYEKKLEDAKLADSKASGVRREPRGGNFYAEAMKSRGPRHDMDVLRRW